MSADNRERCPVKVWPEQGVIRQCSRYVIGRRGLCSQHEKCLDRGDKRLPLIDGGYIVASGKTYPPQEPAKWS